MHIQSLKVFMTKEIMAHPRNNLYISTWLFIRLRHLFRYFMVRAGIQLIHTFFLIFLFLPYQPLYEFFFLVIQISQNNLSCRVIYTTTIGCLESSHQYLFKVEAIIVKVGQEIMLQCRWDLWVFFTRSFKHQTEFIHKEK